VTPPLKVRNCPNPPGKRRALRQETLQNPDLERHWPRPRGVDLRLAPSTAEDGPALLTPSDITRRTIAWASIRVPAPEDDAVFRDHREGPTSTRFTEGSALDGNDRGRVVNHGWRC
jgi:hypothetical protein